MNELASAEAPDLSVLYVNEAGTSFGSGHQPVCSYKRLGHDARADVNPLLVPALDILGRHSGPKHKQGALFTLMRRACL